MTGCHLFLHPSASFAYGEFRYSQPYQEDGLTYSLLTRGRYQEALNPAFNDQLTVSFSPAVDFSYFYDQWIISISGDTTLWVKQETARERLNNEYRVAFDTLYFYQEAMGFASIDGFTAKRNSQETITRQNLTSLINAPSEENGLATQFRVGDDSALVQYLTDIQYLTRDIQRQSQPDSNVNHLLALTGFSIQSFTATRWLIEFSYLNEESLQAGKAQAELNRLRLATGIAFDATSAIQGAALVGMDYPKSKLSTTQLDESYISLEAQLQWTPTNFFTAELALDRRVSIDPEIQLPIEKTAYYVASLFTLSDAWDTKLSLSQIDDQSQDPFIQDRMLSQLNYQLGWTPSSPWRITLNYTYSDIEASDLGNKTHRNLIELAVKWQSY